MLKNIRRNESCPCGSGHKFKHCCGTIGQQNSTRPQFFQPKLNEHQIRTHQRESTYGKAKEIIHADCQDIKFVAVGNELHWNPKWKTFPDFLGGYLSSIFGQEWRNTELKKPLTERHEILKWYASICRYQTKFHADSDGIHKVSPSGAMKAWYQLAYDLYTIQHNAKLQEFLIRRLKISDQFQGALYEANVAATLIHAGYEIEFEDETDGTSKHPEFIATNRASGEKIAVEAKSRHRSGILGQPGAVGDYEHISTDAKRILNKAFAKQSHLPFLVFLNLNVPPIRGRYEDSRWFKEIEHLVAAKEKRTNPKQTFPVSAIIFTNAPYYWQLNERAIDHGWAYGRFIAHPTVPLADINVVKGLVIASRQNANIPNEFPKN